jgi:ABC-type phosphate transport system substrate-binding protein
VLPLNLVHSGVGLRRRGPTRFRLLLASLVLAVATATTFVVVPRSDAAPPHTLTVTPPTGLVNQVVQVRWSGFNPTTVAGASVTLYQCKAAPASLADCYTVIRPPAGGDPEGSGFENGVTNADGTGSASLEVRPALDLPVLGCTATHACSIVAFENDGQPIPPNGLPATAVTAPLQFAPSPTDCPHVGTPDVTTLGEESAQAALYSWSAQVCNGQKPLALDYTAKGSPEGRRNFLDGNVDVGLSSMPVQPDEKALATRDVAYAPIDLTGVVVAFNVTDTVTNQKITDMNLTPRLVAMLIAAPQFGGPGKALFQDPEFLSLNPGHNWPINTQPPGLRAERNADTYVLTNWLQRDSAARTFLDGKDTTAPVDDFWKGVTYPTDLFESRDPAVQGVYNPRTGTIVNARRLFNFQAPGDGVTISADTEGLFAVMDGVTAYRFGLPTAKLRPANAPNAAFVAADAAGINAGYAGMKANADGVTKVADPTNATGYPLVKVDYALVPTTGIADTVKRGHITQFLDYASGTGQQAGSLPGGYVPLPAELVPQVVKARDAVMAQSGVDPNPVAQEPANLSTDQAPLTDAPLSDSPALDPSSLGASGSSFDGSSGTAAAAPGTPVRAAAAASSLRRPTSTNPAGSVVSGLRNFLGGDHQLFLPALLVVGLLAIIAGPLITLRSHGKLGFRRRVRGGLARAAGR